MSELALQLKLLYEALVEHRVHTVRIGRGLASFAVGPHLPLLAHSDTAVDRYPQLHSQQTLLLRDSVPEVLERIGPAASPGLVHFVEALGKPELPPSYVPPERLGPAAVRCARGTQGLLRFFCTCSLEAVALQLHQTVAQVLRYAAHLLVWDLAVLLPAGLDRWAQYAPHRHAPLDR